MENILYFFYLIVTISPGFPSESPKKQTICVTVDASDVPVWPAQI